jgi:hypothetical protein
MTTDQTASQLAAPADVHDAHLVLDYHVGACVRLRRAASCITAQKKEIGTHRRPVSNSGRQLVEEMLELKSLNVQGMNIA